ncbi:pimeloyl-ACP methyl ester carboxylesterase [Psychromicrobium silvestre]|uniref:Pimeloyl-ACP methyl ester carboxylesterase n=1 Tax=Psychromicrobium silvestre TaxID=1645614 RepID=A0A7Y9S3K9_9MICC|nr:pimeloyl-ACP methyl ester carboxylesterase [Psychromicrobium silvestre]
MPPDARTSTGIAYDRAGPASRVPLVLIHAGVADRRMWEELWPALSATRDVLRLDLRGFGGSVAPPEGQLSPVDDVLGSLSELGIEHCHLVGASYGAGVAVELALSKPALVESLLLSAPGGSLMPELTPDLQSFFEAERTALVKDDLNAAVEANLRYWVDGPRQPARRVAPEVRELVGRMQRRAFELTADWDDLEEVELKPAALDRLTEVRSRTLVLLGELDLEAIHRAAERVSTEIPNARLVRWSDTAHLPSMERPADFLALLEDWLTEGS